MFKRILVALILLGGTFSARAFEERNILQKTLQNVDIAPSLVMNQGWVPYPVYSDRAGWNSLLDEFVPSIIEMGDKYLDFKWIEITDDDYLAYDRYGDRAVMENKLIENSCTLGRLLIAELAEGKGRYMNDIVKGVEYFCNLRSWALSVHLAKLQKSKSPLPDPSENILALYQGNNSQLLSWVWYFLREEITKIQPGLPERLRALLQERALDPYLERDDFWWMGFDTSSGKKINNWNPWCNQNELLCFMLLENDRDALAQAVEKSMLSLDKYLNTVAGDGACDEGTTYWYKSTAYVMDYANYINMLTCGKIGLLKHDLIKGLGEYIVNADIGDNWQVNFADGTPSRRPISFTIYRYGKAVGNERMKSFAINTYKQYGADPLGADWTLFYQALENLIAVREMKNSAPADYSPNDFVTYPETKICFMRSGKAFLGAKGGDNFENHNHNDVGSYVYFYDYKPVLVDAGVGAYTRDTFGPNRYKNWFVNSDWHNLPSINGCQQSFGKEFCSDEISVSKFFRSFKTDIAGAYADSANVHSWNVKYRLSRKGNLKIVHKFEVDSLIKTNVLHFLAANEPVIVSEGEISLGNGMVMTYDPEQFEVNVEAKNLVGLDFSYRWGDNLYRINFTAKKLENKGRYTFNIKYKGEESFEEIAARVAEVAKAQYPLLEARLGKGMTPRGINQDGTMKDRNVGSWTSGFFPGNLWYVYMLSPDEDVLAMAERQTHVLDSLLSFPQSHDLGFQVNCSYGNAYRITGKEEYLSHIENGARALAGRYNPKAGVTLSWASGPQGKFPVIIDNMMNLELLTYSARLFGADSLVDMSIKHAQTTMKNHFRDDYSCYHLVDYDPQTGEVLRKATVQGYADESAWARGQAWAIYGYTMMYRETGRKEFLEQAENVAKMLLSRLPYDGIPFWDFDYPEIPYTYKDASAGAVMASAFVELSTLTKDKKLARKCLAKAEKQIRALASKEYLAPVGENGNFLLMHSVGNLNNMSEVDSPLIYADYYFLEALYRYINL